MPNANPAEAREAPARRYMDAYGLAVHLAKYVETLPPRHPERKLLADASRYLHETIKAHNATKRERSKLRRGMETMETTIATLEAQLRDAKATIGALMQGDGGHIPHRPAPEPLDADAALGAALRRILAETGQSVTVNRKVEPFYSVHATFGKIPDHVSAPLESFESLDEAVTVAAETADAYFSKHPPVIKHRKDLPSIRDVQRAWQEAHDANFDPNSSDWQRRVQRHPQGGGGNLFSLDGRPFSPSTRCAFCREFDTFTDTGYCPTCEAEVPEAARKMEAAIFAAETQPASSAREATT